LNLPSGVIKRRYPGWKIYKSVLAWAINGASNATAVDYQRVIWWINGYQRLSMVINGNLVNQWLSNGYRVILVFH